MVAFMQAYRQGYAALPSNGSNEGDRHAAREAALPAMALLAATLDALGPGCRGGFVLPASLPVSSRQQAAGEADAAEDPAAPRPRAPSRLLETPFPVPRAATPAAGPLLQPTSPAQDSDMESDGMAQQVNRLLLDQAWLRGVDLT